MTRTGSECCEWRTGKYESDPDFQSKILFLSEANFQASGKMNKQHYRYWSLENLNCMDVIKEQGSPRVLMQCALRDPTIAGPSSFRGTVNAENYLQTPQNEALPSLLNEGGNFTQWFQQDGSPDHYGLK